MRDDDGDGICEVHVNTVEGMWTTVRKWVVEQPMLDGRKGIVYLRQGMDGWHSCSIRHWV